MTLALSMGVDAHGKRNALSKFPAVEHVGMHDGHMLRQDGTLTPKLDDGHGTFSSTESGWILRRRHRPEAISPWTAGLSLEMISEWPVLRRLLECSLICNNARLEKSGGEYRVLGDPTEGALMTLAEKAGVRGTYQRLYLNSFDSLRKRMSVAVSLAGRREKILYAKGAPLQCSSDANLSGRRRDAPAVDIADRRRIMAGTTRWGRGLVVWRSHTATPRNFRARAAARRNRERAWSFRLARCPTRSYRRSPRRSWRATPPLRIIMITGDYAPDRAHIAAEVRKRRRSKL